MAAVMVTCPTCEGEPALQPYCLVCAGAGEIEAILADENFWDTLEDEPCQECFQSGLCDNCGKEPEGDIYISYSTYQCMSCGNVYQEEFILCEDCNK